MNSKCLSKRSVFKRKPLPGLRDGSYVVGENGRIFIIQADGSQLPFEGSDAASERLRGLIGVRDTARDLMQLNIAGASDADLAAAQSALNSAYEQFAQEYGPVTSASNQRVFKRDPDLSLMLDLERVDPDGNVAKSPLFSRRTVAVDEVPTQAETAAEALAISLNEQGRINWVRMSSLTGLDADELQYRLRGKIFEDPQTGEWMLAEEYLSGNVRAKLREAELYAQQGTRFHANIDALQGAIPADLALDDIDFNLGMGWIPPEVITGFSKYLFNEYPHLDGAKSPEFIYIPELGEWVVAKESGLKKDPRNTSLWGTKRLDGMAILERTLNGRTITAYDSIEQSGKKKRVLNRAETVEARAVQARMQKAFRQWIKADPETSQRLVGMYNEQFNATAPRKFDGSYLNLPGQAADMFQFRQHQNDATARIVSSAADDENTGLFHVVGAGKTAAMIASSMEMRRLGIRNKPAHVIPNHMLQQYAGDFLRQYPGANLLLVNSDSLSKANKEETLQRMANGDWDAVVMTHAAFGRIPTSNATRATMLKSDVQELNGRLAALNQLPDSDARQAAIKRVERERRPMMAEIEKLLKGNEGGTNWEDLGIDHLYVDEAETIIANLGFKSKRNIPGVGSNNDSKKAADLESKIRFMNNRCKCGKFVGNDGVCSSCQNKTEMMPGTTTLSTGTPVRNSLSQMYVIQKALQRDRLQEMGMLPFDAWASNYGRASTQLEMKPSGSGYRMHTRFSKFANVGEMLRTFHEVADVQLDPDALNLNRPDVKGGMPEGVAVPASDWLKDFIADCDHRMENLPDDPSEDNMLKIINDADKAALDRRLIDVNLPDDPNSKVNIAIGRMLDIYKATTGVEVEDLAGPQNMAQAVFLDTSTPKDSVAFSQSSKSMAASMLSNDQQLKMLAFQIFTNPPEDDRAWRRLPGLRYAGDEELERVKDFAVHGRRNVQLMGDLLRPFLAEDALREAYRARFEPIDDFAQGLGISTNQAEMLREMAMRDNFNLYDDIKLKLMRGGVPEDEIAFIHDAKNDAEKMALFDKVNRGRVRYILGSTQKMGAGTNIQRRLAAMHSLDAPWRPSDQAQREGRILRQGNLNDEVGVMRYATEGSFDVYRWQLLNSKAKFIAQAMSNDLNIRTVEDVDELTMDYAVMKALATGNPLMLEQVQVEDQLRDLQTLKRGYEDRKQQSRQALARIPMRMEVAKSEMSRLQWASMSIQKGKPLQLGGTVFAKQTPAAMSAFDDVLGQWRGRSGEADIGELYGCKITMIGMDNDIPIVRIRAGDVDIDIDMDAPTARGNLTKLRNGFKRIGREVGMQQEIIADLEADMPKHRTILAEPFAEEKRMQQLEKRAAELTKELGQAGLSQQAAGDDAVIVPSSTIPQELPNFLQVSNASPETAGAAFAKLCQSYQWDELQLTFLQTAGEVVERGERPFGNGTMHAALYGVAMYPPFTDDEWRHVGEFTNQFMKNRVVTLPDNLRHRKGGDVNASFDNFLQSKFWTPTQKSYIRLARSFAQRETSPYDTRGGSDALHPAFERVSRVIPFGPDDAEAFHKFLKQFF